MKMLTLKRVATGVQGTFGVLLDGDEPFCLTCEDPWSGNQANVSCIPDGVYLCGRVLSPKFGETFEVLRVTDRTHILYHRGNTAEDTHGCILLGEQYERMAGAWGISRSGEAFKEFMARLTGQTTFQVLIKWA